MKKIQIEVLLVDAEIGGIKMQSRFVQTDAQGVVEMPILRSNFVKAVGFMKQELRA